MAIYFITSNKNKFNEACRIIPGLKQMEISLPEIQDIDAKKIIEIKLKEAFKHHNGPFIVDDTSLCFDCLKGLPGPLIKWFLERLGREGLFEICDRFKNYKAHAVCMIGYAKNLEEMHFFEGRVDGKIVKPKGDYFGWDPIFIPDGYDKTFAEMFGDEKNSISHRRLALQKLNEYLSRESGV